MDYHQALSKLSLIDQQHLLSHWAELDTEQKKHILSQVETIDPKNFLVRRSLVLNLVKTDSTPLSPPKEVFYSGNESDYQKGKELTSEGKVGTIVMAGGQGTRLGFNGPKGIYPVSLIKHKSLFQLLAEKTKAASKQAGVSLSMALMTSPLNHQETIDFFESHHFFGLDKDQISFFSQSMVPLMTEEGNLFLEHGLIAMGPDGNGEALTHFVQQGIWRKWTEKGIDYLNFILIDNALADPFDAELVGFHSRHHCTITVKGCLREDPREKVGLLVEQNQQTAVVEYSEIEEEERTAKTAEGKLKYPCANLSLFCFSMDHVLELSKKNEQLPYHLAHKKGVWKFEKFIFDLLPFSNNVKILVYPREECFAPLKNKEGEGSVEMVQKALLARDRQILASITGNPPPDHPFELSPDFYYPTPELLKNWQGKQFPADLYYIEIH